MALDDKLQELIAIGASITANCQPCLAYHVEKAREFGADDEAVAKAIEIGKLVRKGAQAKMDRFAAGCTDKEEACCRGEAQSSCDCAR
jgi:AhpD family alkylhydroperoxidase